MLRLHNPPVRSRLPHYKRIPEEPRVRGAERDTDERRDVRDADHAGGEIVPRGEDQRGGGVEHVEPDEVCAVGEAGVEDDGERGEEKGARCHFFELVGLLEVGGLEGEEFGEVGFGRGMGWERGGGRAGGGCCGGFFGGGWGGGAGCDAGVVTDEVRFFHEEEEEGET